MGKSKPWPEAFKKLTEVKRWMLALSEYFESLRKWMVEQRIEMGYTGPEWDVGGWSIGGSSHTVLHCHGFFDCVSCVVLLEIFKRPGPEAMINRLRFQCFFSVFNLSLSW